MTEEEKKAIEDLKLTIEQEKEELPYSKESLKNNETLLNLIEKLKKEIEEKTIIIMAGAEKVKQLEKEFIIKQEVKENYIPKDKIREKLNWYEDTCERLSKSGIELDMYERYQGAIELGEELLEEE